MNVTRARKARTETSLSTFDLERYLASLGPLAFAIFNDASDPAAEMEKLGNDMLSLHGRAEAILANADEEGRDVTPTEAAQLDRIFAKWNEAKDKYEAAASKSAGRQTEPETPGARVEHMRAATGDLIDQGARRPAAVARPGMTAVTGAVAQRRPELLIQNLFRDERPDLAGWRDFREFVAAVHSGLADPRFIKAATGGSEGVGVDGGFAVPTQFSDRLLNLSLEGEIVRPRAQGVALDSNILELPMFDDEDHSANIAGFSAQWLGEGGTGTEQKAKLRKLNMRAKKLGLWTKVTSELVEDSATFEARLETAMAEAIGWNADDAFFRGTGAGQPQGILTTAPSKIEVAKEGGQVADTIVYENLIKMWARLWPRGARNAVWLIHPSTLPQLLKVQRIIQNVAGSENVGGDTLDVQSDAAGNITLLTRPAIITEHVNQLGDAGDIALVDFSQYLVGVRRMVTTQREISSGWLTDEVGIRSITRLDGQDTWSAPFQPRTGPTLSWVITLAERA